MKSRWDEIEIDEAFRHPGMDPAAWWLLIPGRSEFLTDEDSWISALVDIRREGAFEILRRATAEIFVPFPDEEFLEESRIVGALIEHSALLVGEHLPSLLAEDAIRIKLSPLLAHPPEFELAAPEITTVPECSVITAIIDDAITVGHERFRMSDGTSRVHHFWIMDPAVTPATGATVAVGREWSKAGVGGIDDLLNDASNGGRVDEERFMRLAGMITPATRRLGGEMRRLSHGTHVLDTAAGYPPGDDRADRPIIAVQFPPFAVEDTSGTTLDGVIGQALSFICDRARAIATASGFGEIPVVLNISYGFTAGAHDGTSLIEQMFDGLISLADPPIQIFLSAGNGHLERGHAVVPPPDGTSQNSYTIDWRVQADDRTQTLMQLWLPGPASGSSRVEVSLETPAGDRSAPLGETPFSVRILRRLDVPSAPIVAALTYAVDPQSGRGLFEARLLPTARDPGHPDPLLVVPSGQWRVEVKILEPDEITTESPVRIWIQRDDSIPGYPRRGRQSRMEHPEHGQPTGAEFAAAPVLDLPSNRPVPGMVPVRREYMLNAIATGNTPIVAGGYERKRRLAAGYSTGGPFSEPEGWPTLLVDADSGPAHPGTIAAAPRSGGWSAMSGTSVASPAIARYGAGMFAASVFPSRTKIRLHASANDDGTLARGKTDLPPDRGAPGRLRLSPVESQGRGVAAED